MLDQLRDSKTFADLTLNVRDHGPATVVELTGEFDAYTAFELRRHLALYPSSRFVHVVMDLRELGFVDSAGIAVIVALSKQATARCGTLCLVLPENHLLVKLRRMGLVKLWSIYETVESAIDAVTRIADTGAADQAAMTASPATTNASTAIPGTVSPSVNPSLSPTAVNAAGI